MKFLKKIFYRVKRDVFLIRRLLQEGYGPRYWWPYFKNRFLGNYLIKYMPRCEYVADPDFELHTICNKEGLWMLYWMLHSFIAMSKLRPTIIVHDDGTLDKAAEKLILSKFPHTKIMFRDETIKQLMEMPNIPNIVKEARRKDHHFFFDKMTDSIILGKAKKMLMSDIDIIYYKPPIEIMDFVLGRTNYDAMASRGGWFDLMMDDYYTKKYKLNEKNVHMLNGGYLLFNREKLSVDQIVEFLEHTKRPITDYFIEMAGWACVLAQLNFTYLSNEKYIIKGRITEKTIYKHFTSPRRYELYAYGVDRVRKILDV